MKIILCVEDDVRILTNNRDVLMNAGYVVLTAESLVQAKNHLATHKPDAIVLDIMLPDGNGLEYLMELRANANNIPVLMLSAKNKSSDIARGLDAGANDYMGKPFSYDVLLSRIRKMLFFSERIPDILIRDPFRLDITALVAYFNGEDLLLTQKEFSLLMIFTQNEGKSISVEYLYEKAWGRSMVEDTGTVKYQVSNLRKKLTGSGYTITSLRGKGYCFERE